MAKRLTGKTVALPIAFNGESVGVRGGGIPKRGRKRPPLILPFSP